MARSMKELIFPSRRTELTGIRTSRTIFLSFLYIGVAIYFCWKVYKLSKDERTLSYQRDTKNPIPAPIVTFTSLYQFTVACGVVYTENGNFGTDDCGAYVNVDNSYKDLGYYAMTFDAPNLNFADPNSITNGPVLRQLSMEVTINDPSYRGGDASMSVLLTDKDTVPDLQIASQKQHIQGMSNFVATAVLGNLYYLANNQAYAVFFERKITNFLNQNAANVLSGNGNHKPLTLLSSTLVSYPNVDQSYAAVGIKPSSYVVITETEDSSFTISDLISAVGGIYGAAIAIYVCFFGADEIGPWGCVQRLLPCARRRVRSRLYDSLSPNIPFSGSVYSKSFSYDQKFEAVGQRLLSLELFLKEYVVDADAMIKSDANGDIY